ncbi:centromere-associated protein E-like [Battus philenor]|uniref:centromere-associated protein E-like n=1 Tax=Battus philenor TaxID=42288 RepID=UPI0035CF6094
MDNKEISCKKLFKKCTRIEKLDAGEVDEKYQSMGSLIAWNVSKVLRSNPNIDLKLEITAMQEQLESNLWDVNSVISNYPDKRYLACALLAWQQMGHGDTNSLYHFIQTNLDRVYAKHSETLVTEVNYVVSTDKITYVPNVGQQDSELFNKIESPDSEQCLKLRPFMKMPVETKIVMRCDMCKPKPSKPANTDSKKKGETPCCVKSACKQRLAEMDASTCELKKRLQQLAKREEERQKLLTRAETSWRDLENNYIRRLKLAEEKEEDISKQIKNSIEERNDYKSVCGVLSKQLEERGAVVQKEGESLKKVEAEVCERARKKFKITEDMACSESCLAQHQCRAAQIERDLRFKEEQVRRKVKNLEDTAESLRGLRCEAERALRNELGALKDQVAKISKRLLMEEAESSNIRNELDELRVNKSNILEDLDACKIMCDHHMQGQIAEIKKKTDELADIKEKLLECRCKLPQDTCVEVKRTPSLAAICRCSSEDNIQDSCSCTSLRSSLLSNLLKDLFGGLQSELGDNGSIMPCQLLKCLEDKHSWDRSTPVKSNLGSFFSKLLVGELDIAIASSIEKYHVKWVGTSCVDETSRIPNDVEVEEWQQQALENKAQKLAKQLAEQLFQEKADQLIEKAKGILAGTPPPCQCGNPPTPSTYPCIINTHMNKLHVGKSTEENISPIVERNNKNQVMQVHVPTVERKMKLPKKNLSKSTKDRNNNKVQRSYGPGNSTLLESKKPKGFGINQKFNNRAVSTDRNDTFTISLDSPKSYKTERNSLNEYAKKNSINPDISVKYSGKNFKRQTQSYAVNLCLCEPQKDENIKDPLPKNVVDTSSIQEQSNSEIEGVNKVSFPCSEIDNLFTLPLHISKTNLKTFQDIPCSKDCLCLNKTPSNTSLNKLLDTLLHGELKLNHLLNKENISDCKPKVENHVKACQDVFTNTLDECKSYKCVETFVDGSHFKNPSNFSEQFNVISKMCKEEKDVKNTENISCKNVETGVYDREYYKKLGIDETTTENYNKRYLNFINNRFIYKQDNLTYDQCCKYTSIEKNYCNMPTSVQSLLLQGKRDNFNLLANYIVDNSKIPLNSNCNVEFLGVTLSNNDSNNPCNNRILKNVTSHRLLLDACQCTGQESQKEPKNNIDELKTEKLKKVSYKNMCILTQKNDCICCNEGEENNDLELNTFELLTEYLQKKVEEFKSSMCKSSVAPHEEERMYNEILKKVKQIILEMNNELACKCCENSKNDDIDASWKRACSLLQEYLRIKIKRIQCSCSVTMKNSNIVLPEMLEKVCQLIENDFKQLKDTYYNKNILKKEQKSLKGKQTQKIQASSDLHSNEINSNTKRIFVYDALKNHANTENASINFVKFEDKNEQATLAKIEGASANSSFYNDKLLLDTKNIASQFTVSLNNILDEKVFMSIFPEDNENVNYTSKEVKIKKNSIPYIGYTLDCPCDKMLGPCVCAKSVLANSKAKTDNIWKIKANKNMSYIMQSVVEGNSSDLKTVDSFLQEANKISCNKEMDTNKNEDEIKLKPSNHNLENAVHNFTNTSHIYIYDDVDYLSYDDWDDCESSFCPNLKEACSNKEKLFDSLHLPIEKSRTLTDSDDALMSDIKTQSCTCEMVPICHVKMLIDNIGRQLENSKCTCDSLNPNVCPVHF